MTEKRTKNINTILNDYLSITNLSRAVQNLLLSTPSPSIFSHVKIWDILHSANNGYFVLLVISRCYHMGVSAIWVFIFRVFDLLHEPKASEIRKKREK